MKILGGILLSLAGLNSSQAAPLHVLSNNLDAAGQREFPSAALTWFQKNMPVLAGTPEQYLEGQGFIPYEPLFPYVDSVNWSLFQLAQFGHENYEKQRYFHVPSGTRVRRDPVTHAWRWPVGSEMAKLVRVRVRQADGTTRMVPIEFRLGRKIADKANARANWAMVTYVQKSGRWQVAMPPELEISIPNAVRFTGNVDTVSYRLTAPEACLTCHSRAENSPVDYHRGAEAIYGVNDEALTGVSRLRRGSFLNWPEAERAKAEVLAESESEDWVDLKSNDAERLRKLREAVQPFVAQ